MAGEEEIRLKFVQDDAFFAEMDRRFEALARRAAQQFAQVGKGMGGGGGGGGGASGMAGMVPGGGGGQQAGMVGSALGQVGAAVFNGIGQGFQNTSAASASSPTVLAQNAQMGVAQAGVSLAKTGLQLLGGAVGGAVAGPGGALAGAAAGGALGDFIQLQFNSVKEAMEVPRDRSTARLKSVYGNLAASGYQASQAEMQEAAEFTLGIERRRYEGERQIQRVTEEVSARTANSYGLSFLGR